MKNTFILPNVVLDRDYTDDKCTLGTLWFDQEVVQTLELPFKDNKQNISCIPDGEYIVRKTVSPAWTKSERDRIKHLKPNITKEELEKIQVKLWLVLDVPNRSGIRFHSANFVSQLRGCIAPGLRRWDINNDGIIDIMDSKKALSLMEEFLPEEFKLIVRWKLGKNS